jgi:hypothetical protein
MVLALAVSLLFAAAPAFARIDAEAVSGRPFGVGRVTITKADLRSSINEDAVQISERDGRIFYPSFSYGRFGALIGEAIGIGDGSPGNVTIMFLFTGDEPLGITVNAPDAVRFELVPRARGPRDLDRLLARYWKEYHNSIKEQRKAGDYPPWVQTYLSAMLSRRIGLQSPLLAPEPSDEGIQVLELIGGSERIRDAALRDTVLGRVDFAAPADVPLPAPIDWRELSPPADESVQIEAIAQRVPRECGYVRFGRFANFLWFNKLLEEYGGDLGRLVTTRGFQQAMSNRLETQLQMKTDALAELLGETVIADVALVGRDFFMQEGPAMGVLFQAKNTALLANDFNNKRKAALAREKDAGCTLETVKIAGHDVSFLSTADNRIRSFYAVDGDFHFITTSRAMVERFFETGKDDSSIGDLQEFRYARTQMPLSREDTVFAYFSSPFLQGLASPHYQVELRRRMQSVTDIQVLYLAQLAARGERAPADRIDELVDGGLLPQGFGRRPDGSGIVAADNGPVDSLRGARGTFAPVPDIEIDAITADEARRCALQAEYYAAHWKQMDPLMVGIRRFKKNDTGLERIVVDAHISPFEETKYGWLTSMLGPTSKTRISAAPDDVITVQAFLSGGGLFDLTAPPHHMFLGVQDHLPLENLRPTGLLKTLQLLRSTPGYLGAWPKTGFIDRLPLGLGGGPPDEFGYSRLPLGLWRRQGREGFSVLSFDPGVLEKVTPQLAVEEADDEAQVRVHVGDLANTKVSGLVSNIYYEQARRTSQGNARFMQSLVQQLRVPIDDAKVTAEKLLDAKLVCTLGGEYEIARGRGGGEYWISTAAPSSLNYRLPPDYVAPLLVWFRGLDAGVVKTPERLVAHVEFDMQRKKGEEPKFELPQVPLFNLFGAPKEPQPKEDLPPTEPKKLFPDNPPPRPKPKGREL